MREDRHGRARRLDNDLRRRPADGFRAASRVRFVRLVQDACALLPEHIATHLRDAELIVASVPEAVAAAATGDVELASFIPRRPGARARLVVYRRALELRAGDREDLMDLLGGAAHRAVADALGLPREDDDLD